MGCGTGYAGVVAVMAHELARERGDDRYLHDAADGIRAEVAERGLRGAAPVPAPRRQSDLRAVVVVLVALLVLAGTFVGAVATWHAEQAAGEPDD